jgi:hypothetical protein
MTRKSKSSEPPRIGRKDLQDPDRDVRSPRKGGVERDADRSGSGRPIDEEGRSRPADSDSPRPTDDAPVAK